LVIEAANVRTRGLRDEARRSSTLAHVDGRVGEPPARAELLTVNLNAWSPPFIRSLFDETTKEIDDALEHD
jgi:hypothetical protein